MLGETNHNNTRVLSKYAPDLAKDTLLRLAQQLPLGPLTVLGGVLYAIGGLPLFLWGGCLRVVVRPACHLAGQFGDPYVGPAPV